MFTKMCANDGSVLSEAGIATFVTSTDGKYLSGVKIYGDDISLSASHKLTISGDYIVINTTNFSIDESGDVDITGKVTATSGKIAGFTISNNGLSNTPFDNDAYVIFRNDSHKCFAGIGGNVLPSSSGIRGVARFENEDESDWWGLNSNYAIIASAKGSNTANVAMAIDGGYISGMAIKTKTYGLDVTTSSTDLAALSATIPRDVNAVWATTSYYYSNGTTKTKKHRDVTLKMPDTYQYDHGHFLMIKRGSDSDNALNLTPGTNTYKEYNSSTGKYDTKTAKSYFLKDGDVEVASMSLESEGDACTFVFFPNFTCVIDSYTYVGCWVQWKNPRDW
jgi:hypothetical protein